MEPSPTPTMNPDRAGRIRLADGIGLVQKREMFRKASNISFLLPLHFVASVLLSSAPAAGADDWPWWRGPGRDGVAGPDQRPPARFGESENVRWVAAVPGRGHGSPTVVGDRVVLATADEEKGTQSVMCFDRATGEERWVTVVHKGGLKDQLNKKATHASSTPACDGERLFINFLKNGSVITTALSLRGERLWQTKITDYVVHQGFGSSPAVHGPLVIVSADNKGGGAICGLDRKSGEVVWKVERPEKPNYASPIIFEAAGREQLVFQGCDLVSSFDPLTGEKLWEVEGATTECVASVVTDGERVFTSGGYPKNHVAAVAADGSGEVVWENISRVYVPSMLVRDGYLFAVMDNGVAVCWKSDTGERMWRERVGRTTTSSPVLVGDHLYVADESGQFTVFKADPEAFEIVGQNQLGDKVFATPTICDGEIFARVVETRGGDRKEKLYCISAEKTH